MCTACRCSPCCAQKWSEEEVSLLFSNLQVNICGRKFLPNVIKTRTYNWVTFPFAVLLLQFKPFFSQFFTVIALLQLFRPLKVGLAFTYYLPLIFIFLVSIGRELYTEIGCYKRDKVVNSMTYQVLREDGVRTVRSEELQVGDIIYLSPGQNIPADIIILHGTEPLHLKTTNLDGETDYKPRVAIFGTADVTSESYKNTLKETLDSYILTYEAPSSQLYNFNGKFALRSPSSETFSSTVVPLSLCNTAWMNCTFAKGSVTGLIIYTGMHVRIMLGRKKPRNKTGKIDIDINLYVKGLFVLCVFLAFVLTSAGSVQTLVTFIRWIIILNAIIPLAMKVSLEYGKFTLAGTITHDPEIPGIKVHNSNLVEELGLISHIFSDKTGTLTKNEMWLHEIIGDRFNSADEYKENILHSLMICHNVEVVTERSQCLKVERADAGMSGGHDTTSATSATSAIAATATASATVSTNCTNSATSTFIPQGFTASSCIDTIDGMLFFTDFITNESTLLNRYIGASPDEVATIRSMHARGFILQEGVDKHVRYSSPTGLQEFDILHVIPFSSDTKRMAVIARHMKTDIIHVFVKGADTVIEVLSKPCYWLRSVVDQLAIAGRRTLVYAHKVLIPQEFTHFQQSILSAAEDLTNKQAKMAQAESDLLANLTIMCITGIEDQLQESVKDTIRDIKRAGIKFWMLTGDKVITSLSIARACGLLPNDILSTHSEFHASLSRTDGSTPREMAGGATAITPVRSLMQSADTYTGTQFLNKDVPTVGVVPPMNDMINVLSANPVQPTAISLSLPSPKKRLIQPRFKDKDGNSAHYSLPASPQKSSASSSRFTTKRLKHNKTATASLHTSPYVRVSRGVFFLTEELSLDRLLQTLHDISKAVKDKEEITVIIDGAAIDTLLGTYPADYFYHYYIHPITGTLLPLPLPIRLWRLLVKFIYIYFTGRVKSKKGSLGPDAKLRDLFASITSRAKTVICCRCTPAQKALVANIITIYSGKQSLGIGDGANDVPLIQCCGVGVGIAGKEGTQAANSADFVVSEFQGLRKLLFWHGRNSYIGSAQMCQFIMQRGITQTLIQIWFSMFYYFTTQVIYTGVLLLGFSTFFTMFPPFNYYINEDIDYSLVMQYPEVYRYTSCGRLISFKTFCLWLLAGVEMSLMIVISTVRILPSEILYAEFVLLTFAAMLINELLLVAFTTHRWSVILIIALVSSLFSFYIVQSIYPDVFPLSMLYSFKFTWETVLISGLATVPAYLGSLIIRYLGVPPVIRKLRKLRKPATCACFSSGTRPCCRKSCIHYYSSTGTYYFNLTKKASYILACKYCPMCKRANREVEN